ncbi:MAG: hypothetical protein RLY58_1225, partial [Pseudomonadota bacterium]
PNDSTDKAIESYHYLMIGRSGHPHCSYDLSLHRYMFGGLIKFRTTIAQGVI